MGRGITRKEFTMDANNTIFSKIIRILKTCTIENAKSELLKIGLSYTDDEISEFKNRYARE